MPTHTTHKHTYHTHHTHHTQTHLPHTPHTPHANTPTTHTTHTTHTYPYTPPPSTHCHTVTLSLTWSVLRMRGGDLDCRRHVFSFIQFLQHARHKRKRRSTHNIKVQAATITTKKNRVTFILKRAWNRFSFKNIKAWVRYTCVAIIRSENIVGLCTNLDLKIEDFTIVKSTVYQEFHKLYLKTESNRISLNSKQYTSYLITVNN